MTSYQPPPPPTRRVQPAALRTAFPGWTFTVTPGSGPVRFTAQRVQGTGSLHAVATTSAKELRRILLLAGRA
jgi:hypothetical protein